MPNNQTERKSPQFYVLAIVKWNNANTDLPKNVYVPVANPLLPTKWLINEVHEYIQNEYGCEVSQTSLTLAN